MDSTPRGRSAQTVLETTWAGRLCPPAVFRGLAPVWTWAFLLWALPVFAAVQDVVPINPRTVHLRSGSEPEWDEFAGRVPDGSELVRTFQSTAHSEETTLFLEQDNVKLDWPVLLNGKKLGTLFLMEAPLVHALAVRAGTLRDGENTLAIRAPKENDDIVIGRIWLDRRPRRDCLTDSIVSVDVTDPDTKASLPCRITILDEASRLAALFTESNPKLAARPGVVYTATGSASIGLRPGQYTIHATRGFEFGCATRRLSLVSGERAHVPLELRREVPTDGLVSCDTHIHCFTYARHGDATYDERAVTLAGEGIELPISTEHDQAIDFSQAAEHTGVAPWLTPVLGDEVTTPRGHFNIFPLGKLAALPDNKVTNWTQLIQVFRGTPGVEVVVLNHPRNIHNNFQPFAATNFNAVTGENLCGPEFTFDAIEVANSSAMQSDWMVSFRDWFALLNYGYRFTAVGSSDGHDVSRYIVGQGRTYIACPDRDPAHIPIDIACRNLKEERALVSLGLLTQMTVAGKFSVGDLATQLGDMVDVSVTVLGPSWAHADLVELFANGVKVREEKIHRAASATQQGPSAAPENIQVRWRIPRPAHDTWLVALATGPAVLEPFWALARPYQPSSPSWRPRVLGATNPIWLDADGDGAFTSARVYAKRLVARSGRDVASLISELSSYDEAVAAQAASFCNHAGLDLKDPAVQQQLAKASAETQRGFTAYERTQVRSEKP